VAYSIQYPILCIGRGSILAMPSHKEFTTCTTRELKNGWYEDLLLVDSAGKGYRLSHAIMKSGAGLLGGYRPFKRYIRVKPKVKKGPFDVSLEKLKKHILEIIEDDEAEWSEVADVKEIKKAVREADSHPALVALPYW
jgi:hypothetical protein